MSDITMPLRPSANPPSALASENKLSASQWGMLAFLVSEVAFFGTLITAYVAYLHQDTVGPTPREALSLGLVSLTTLCLLASSGTIHVAESRLRAGRQDEFRRWWAGTIALGLTFLAGTAYEWWELISDHHLTISRNLFGTTFYTLVGFHGAHVTVGLIMMLVLLGLALANQVTEKSRSGIELVSWYWHFVDAVWIVVFTLVYVIGR